MKTTFKTLFLCAVIVLTSCSSDDDVMEATETSSILDKWYYDSNGFTADIFFNSNGTHEQRIEALGQTFTSMGNWSWIDQDNGIMKIDNLAGQSQVASELWFRFSDITDTTFMLEQSTDGKNESFM